MAPVLLPQSEVLFDLASKPSPVGQPGAREIQAAGRHGHFGLKPAPAQPRRGDPSRNRDFRRGKEGDIK